MKQEPVAWMLNGILQEFDPSDWAKEQYPDQDVIPLYTHPVKELTDEEILKLKKEHQFFPWFEEDGSVSHYRVRLDDIKEFARAILKKASEK